MISIKHLLWIIPVSMALGASVFMCVCLAFALKDRKDEETEREEIVDAAFNLDF